MIEYQEDFCKEIKDNLIKIITDRLSVKINEFFYKQYTVRIKLGDWGMEVGIPGTDPPTYHLPEYIFEKMFRKPDFPDTPFTLAIKDPPSVGEHSVKLQTEQGIMEINWDLVQMWYDLMPKGIIKQKDIVVNNCGRGIDLDAFL